MYNYAHHFQHYLIGFFFQLDDIYRWNSYLSCKLEYPSLPVLNSKVIIAQGIIETVSVSWKTIFQINSFLFIYSYLTNSYYLIFKTIINIWPIILLIIISISTHAGFMGKVWKMYSIFMVKVRQLENLENKMHRNCRHWLIICSIKLTVGNNKLVRYISDFWPSMDVHIYLIHSTRKARFYPVSLFH